MILEKGNMWDVFGSTDIFMITTNPIIRNDGAIVMGRGIALEVKTRYPTFPYDFARSFLQIQKNIGFVGEYDSQRIYWFMVKDHWQNNAEPEIIKKSIQELKDYFQWSSERIDLNFPGIGNGKLKRSQVLPLLEELPDNVHIWEFK